jgi:hypothetical protein
MTSDDPSATPGQGSPDPVGPGQAVAGLATGSDSGSPGERSAIPPEPGDAAVRELLEQDAPGEALAAAEDDPAMIDAVEDDGPAASLVPDGDAEPASPPFQEPAAQ